MASTEKQDLVLLKALSAKPYKEQAVWFMNGYWNEFFQADKKARESLWNWTHLFIELDPKKKKGCELNEFDAHRFLERIGETLTVKYMREFLRSVDIDFNKMVSLTEYLVSKKKVKWKELIHKPQDDAKAQAERKEAEMAIGAAVESCEEAKSREVAAGARRSEAIAAETKAKAAESKAQSTELKAKADEKAASEKEDSLRESELQAKAKAEEARKAEVESNRAASEVKIALERVLSEEKKINDRKARLAARARDPSIGIVRRNSAVHRLEQLKNKPILGLQTAKVTLTAAEKRASKALEKLKAATRRKEEAAKKISAARSEAEAARKAATAARGRAESDAKAATLSRKAAESAREAANEAFIAATDARKDAQDAIAEAKKRLKVLLAKPRGTGQGAIWWLEREFEEAKKFMPTSKLRRLSAVRK